MDYANQRRVKLWGTARVVEGDADLQAKLSDPAYPGEAERAILFSVEAWDINCPQHIHRRLSERQAAPAIERLRSRVAELEAEVERLRSAPRARTGRLGLPLGSSSRSGVDPVAHPAGDQALDHVVGVEVVREARARSGWPRRGGRAGRRRASGRGRRGCRGTGRAAGRR